jgi:hypothetical protein
MKSATKGKRVNIGDSEQPRRRRTKLRRSTWLMLFRMLTPPTTPNPALLRR